MILAKYVDLSYSLDTNSPMYGNGKGLELEQLTSLDKGNSSNTFRISIPNHAGTHVDAPAHFIKGGRKISEYSFDELIFRKPIVIDVPKSEGNWIEKVDIEKYAAKLSKADCVLIRTGFSKYRGKEVYWKNNPGISPEAISYIRNFKKVRCIGIDCISISGFQNRERGREAHKLAFENNNDLGRPLLIIEDIGLESVRRMKRLVIIPWKIKNLDSAPCSVICEI